MLPWEPKPWKFLGFPTSLCRDVIKDPKNFQCLGSLGSPMHLIIPIVPINLHANLGAPGM